jgi:hypothetical protein
MKLEDRTLILKHHALVLLALGMVVAGTAGCMEQIALFPRPTISEGEPDLTGSVERVDTSAQRLYLRSNGGERRTVTFSNDVQVFFRGREYPITRLTPGDVVAMQIKRDQRGDSYVDLIRIQEEARTDRGLREEPTAPPRIETLSGTVQSVNRRDNSFELNNQPSPIVVALSENVRDSDRERFQTLRSGDHVRIEGRFIGRDRFEMLSFLNADY